VGPGPADTASQSERDSMLTQHTPEGRRSPWHLHDPKLASREQVLKDHGDHLSTQRLSLALQGTGQALWSFLSVPVPHTPAPPLLHPIHTVRHLDLLDLDRYRPCTKQVQDSTVPAQRTFDFRVFL
jgi:hypothetical protein